MPDNVKVGKLLPICQVGNCERTVIAKFEVKRIIRGRN